MSTDDSRTIVDRAEAMALIERVRQERLAHARRARLRPYLEAAFWMAVAVLLVYLACTLLGCA